MEPMKTNAKAVPRSSCAGPREDAIRYQAAAAKEARQPRNRTAVIQLSAKSMKNLVGRLSGPDTTAWISDCARSPWSSRTTSKYAGRVQRSAKRAFGSLEVMTKLELLAISTRSLTDRA